MHDPEDRTGLAPGSYTVTVTDAGGCTDAAAFTITEPDALNVTGNVLDVTITNGSDGSIDVSVSGGTGSYTYDWADLPGSNDPEDRTNLPAGDYTVTVTDANGCTHDKTFTVNEPQCSVNVEGIDVDVTCHGYNNASIDITVSGAQGAYTVDWSDLAGSNDPEDRTGLAPGSYTVTVTDAGGCTDAAAFTITEPDALNVTGNVLDVTITDGSDGSIDVSVSGGTGSYTYDWADLPGSNDPEDRTNLPAGDYTVTVTDANGCTHDKTFTVNEPQCVCTTPAHVTITNLGGDMIQVCWDAQDCATGYIVQYQWKGHSDWNTVEVSAPDHCATIDLKNHLVVYVKVATICSDGSTTNYSTVIKYKYIEPCLGGSNLSSSDVTSNSA